MDLSREKKSRFNFLLADAVTWLKKQFTLHFVFRFWLLLNHMCFSWGSNIVLFDFISVAGHPSAPQQTSLLQPCEAKSWLTAHMYVFDSENTCGGLSLVGYPDLSQISYHGLGFLHKFGSICSSLRAASPENLLVLDQACHPQQPSSRKFPLKTSSKKVYQLLNILVPKKSFSNWWKG